MRRRASRLDPGRFLAAVSCCLLLVLSSCGGGGDSSSLPSSVTPAPRRAADSSAPATPLAGVLVPKFDPCDYFSEQDYEAVMRAAPETVRQGQAGLLRICTRERSAAGTTAVVQVTKAAENLLTSILERAKQSDIRPKPIEVPGARVYFMDETGTLYAYKSGVYLEVFVRAEQDSRGKSIELAKRVLGRIP